MSERVQKMARINVADDAWTALRIQVLREHTTMADRIGELIERAVADAAATPPPAAPSTTNRPKRGGFPVLRPLPEPESSADRPAPGAQWAPLRKE